MVNKLVTLILSVVLTVLVFVPVFEAQASTRIDAPLARTKVENPASERDCLEAFVNSKFSYAHRLCLSLAQQGIREAQLVTGLMYIFGEGTEKNTDLAKLWLNEAARNGSLEAKEALNTIQLTKEK